MWIFHTRLHWSAIFMFEEGVSQPFSWVCPRLGCRKIVRAWHEKSFNDEKNRHLDQHFLIDRSEADAAFERIKQAVYSFQAKPPEHYNKLILPWIDIAFLISRGIRIDDDIEWEDKGYRRSYNPPKEKDGINNS